MRNRNPLIVTLVGLLAVLGLVSSSGPGPSPSSSAAKAKVEEGDGDGDAGEGSAAFDYLRPLREYFGLKESKPVVPPEHDGDAVAAAKLLADIKPRDYQLEFLITTIPDPVASPFAERFDSLLDAMQRAIEVQKQGVLDRSWLPWKRPARGKKGGPRDRAYERQPGTFLFRLKSPARNVPGRLLVLFLVGDTPTAGVHREALHRALSFVHAAGKYYGQKSLPLQGPSFSGSQTSLKLALRDWAKGRVSKKEPLKLRIITGSATSVDRDDFLDLLNDPEHGLTAEFSATVLPNEVMLNELINHIHSRDPRARKIVLLRESNTGYGKETSKTLIKGRQDQQAGEKRDKHGHQHQDGPTIIDMPFPLYISRVRTVFSKHELDKQTGAPATSPNQPKIHVPLEDSSAFESDLPMYPELTAALVEQVIAQILESIAHEKIRHVGIVATDVRDKLFLIRRIRAFAPDVQLFTVIGNVLFSHPDFRRDTYGMLIASSYPLWPRNQQEAGSARTRLHFADQGDAGTYNATLLLLGGEDKLREYWSPDPGQNSGDRLRPPLWISAVGRNGAWPVATILPSDTRLYQEYVHGAKRTPRESDGQEASQPLSWLWFSTVLVMLAACFVVAHAAWNLGIREPNRRAGVLRVPDRAAYQDHLCPPACETDEEFVYAAGTAGVVALFCLYLSLLCFPACCWPEHLVGALATLVFLLTGLILLVIWGSREASGCAFVLGGVLLAGTLAVIFTGQPRGSLVYLLVTAATGTAFVLLASAVTFRALFRGYSWRQPVRLTSLRRTLRLGILGPIVALWVVVYLVAQDYWHSGPATVQVHLLERVTSLTSGLSGLWPAFFLILLVAVCCLVQLRRLHFQGRFRIDYPYPESGRFHALAQGHRAVVRLLDARFILPSAGGKGLVLTAVLAIMLLRLFSQSLRTLEPVVFDVLAAIGFAVVVFFLLFALLRLYELWERVKSLLDRLAALPMAGAFDRLPDKMVALFGRFLNPVRPRASHLVVPLHQLRLLIERYPAVRQDLVNTLHLDVSGWDAFLNEPGTQWMALDTPVPEGDAAAQDRLAELWMAEARALLLAASNSGAGLLAQVWPNRSVAEAFGSGDKEGKDSKKSAPAAPPASPAAEWLTALEDLVAMQTVPYLCQYFVHLRNLVNFLLVAPLLLLVSVASYPFQPQRLLLIFVLSLLGIAVTQTVVMVVQMERDEVLSRITRTTPNRLNFDLGFITTLLTYVTPAVAVMLAVFGDFGGLVSSWFDPILRALK